MKTVDELVVLFQEGKADEDYFSQLIERFKHLIYKYQALYPIKGMTSDDYFQEGCLVLFKSAKLFRKKESYGFAFYFKRAWINRLCSLMRKQYSEWQGIGHQMSIEDYYEAIDSGKDVLNGAPTMAKPESEAIIKETFGAYQKSLSAMERQVFRRMLYGQTDQEMAKALHLNLDQVGSARRRCKRKLRQSLEKDNDF